MYTPLLKRHEYWNHFVARLFVDKVGGGWGVTGPKLAKIKERILRDDNFWEDIILQHGGLDKTPEQLHIDDPLIYDHCLGNFWGMIYQTLTELSLVH